MMRMLLNLWFRRRDGGSWLGKEMGGGWVVTVDMALEGAFAGSLQGVDS